MKDIDNDVVFFFSCIAGLILFMFMHMNSVYTTLDLYIFFIAVGVLIVTPLLYSYYYRRHLSG